MSKYKVNLSSVREEIDSLARDSVSRAGMRLGFSCLGLGLIILGIMYKKLPPEVPLWFSRPYGEEQLAPPWGLGLVLLVSLVIQVLSIRGAGVVAEEDQLASRILVWVGGLVGLMSLITVFQIVRLVT